MHLRCTYGRTYDAPTARFVDFGCSKFRKEIDSNIDLPPAIVSKSGGRAFPLSASESSGDYCKQI